MIEVLEKEKTQCSKDKVSLKYNLKIARMNYQAQEAKKQCAHELMMMERQMHIQMQFRAQAPPAAPAHFGQEAPPFAPHFHAPAAIDPNLFN